MSRPPSRPPLDRSSGSSRPPLTLALSAVICAQVEQSDRPGLLATLRPRPPHPSENLGPARVIPLPRVIPILGRGRGRYRQPETEAELFARDLDPTLNPDLDPPAGPDFDPGPSAA